MPLYIGRKRVCPIVPTWRGFWSVTIHGLSGTVVDCGTQKTIGEDGKVVFKFAEAGAYTFIAIKGSETEVREVELVDGEYNIGINMYIGMTLLEYIEATGTQYIDTGISVKPSLLSKIKIMPTAWNTDARFFGALGPGAGRYRCVDSIGIGAGYWVSLSEYNVNKLCDIELYGFGALKFNGLPKAATTGTFSSPGSYDQNIYIGAVNSPTSIDYGKVKIYSCDIYDNNVLVRSLIPVQLDNRIGMFDNVSGVFFPNAGTGNFVPGPEVA